jgi:hypothetical protein
MIEPFIGRLRIGTFSAFLIATLAHCANATIECVNAPFANHPMNAPIGNRQSAMDAC